MLSYYLSEKAVISKGLTKILDALDLEISEAVIRKENTKVSSYSLQDIKELVDTLSSRYPDCCFVFFGSRAKGKSHKYSDFDLGVFSKDKIESDDFLNMLSIKSEFEDKKPFFIDLVNLNYVDTGFLKNISTHWKLLAGQLSHWLALEDRAVQ